MNDANDPPAWRRNYYLNNREKENARSAKWRQDNRERYLNLLRAWHDAFTAQNGESYSQLYYQKNAEQLKKKARERYHRLKAKKSNPSSS